MTTHYLFIEQNWYESYLAKQRILTGEEVEAAIQIQTDGVGGNSVLSISDDTARIEMKGMLTNKEPSFFDMIFGIQKTTYASLLSAIQAVSENSGIKKVELGVDSPGGEVNGTDDVYQAVSALAKDREVVAINEGTMASAAYYISSAADRIVSTSPMNQSGSIGVVTEAIDNTKALEKAGRDRIILVNRESLKKAPDLQTEEGKDVVLKVLGDMYGVFRDRVVQGRGDRFPAKAIDKTEGQIFLAQEAIEIGLIDAIDEKAVPKFDSSAESTNIGNENGDNITPAVAGKQEEIKMDLQQFLAENPAAAREYQAKLDEAKTQGKDEANAAHEARVKAASPILQSGEYHDKVKNLAADVILGKATAESLLTVVASVDAIREERNSGDAAASSEAVGGSSTNGTGTTPVPEDGVINDEADYQALLKEEGHI
jgi:ClpP class serine protease